jgi:predicted RNA polymerase sigma factor
VAAYDAALDRTTNAAERRLLEHRRDAVSGTGAS